jgi:hypothetical protein
MIIIIKPTTTAARVTGMRANNVNLAIAGGHFRAIQHSVITVKTSKGAKAGEDFTIFFHDLAVI